MESASNSNQDTVSSDNLDALRQTVIWPDGSGSKLEAPEAPQKAQVVFRRKSEKRKG